MSAKTRYRKLFIKRELLSRANYKTWRLTEKVCRKLLFIGPDKEFDWLERREDGSGVVNQEKLSAAISNSHTRFHGQPRREYYMDKVLRLIFLGREDALSTFKRWARNKLEWFLFFRAREITWKTHHYINRKGTDQIDGYLSYTVWGIKCGRALDLCSLNCLKAAGTEWDFEAKKQKKALNYLNLNDYGTWGFPTLLVLKPKIMPKDIDKILNKWYDDQVEWKYRHFSHTEGKPKITVGELLFMEDACEKCGLDMFGCRGHYGEEQE